MSGMVCTSRGAGIFHLKNILNRKKICNLNPPELDEYIAKTRSLVATQTSQHLKMQS